MRPTHFRSAVEFRRWLNAHHASADELWVGYYKKDSGKPSITWPESVDEALCFGWIDGLRKSVDRVSYQIRFSPRKPTSIWSAVNIKRVRALSGRGQMRSAGRKAFAARRRNRSGIYSYEQRPEALPEPFARTLKQNKSAGRYFLSQPASYRRAAIWWVISAKKEETRLKRLGKLISDSSRERRIPQFTPYK
jgi:uncharacterized protein YdeI (YjbR/CyaY-like superfamily)